MTPGWLTGGRAVAGGLVRERESEREKDNLGAAVPPASGYFTCIIAFIIIIISASIAVAPWTWTARLRRHEKRAAPSDLVFIVNDNPVHRPSLFPNVLLAFERMLSIHTGLTHILQIFVSILLPKPEA